MRHAISIVMILVMTPFINSTLQAQHQITSCSTVFTDQGGDNSQYLNNENSSWLICPDTTVEYLTLEFTFVDIETTTDTATYSTGCKDRLFIYDGLDDQGLLIGSYCGEESGSGAESYDPNHTLRVGDRFRPNSPSGCFFVKFESNSTVTKSGWVADVTCCTPSLSQGLTDGVDLPIANNEGRLFNLAVDNSCTRSARLQDFTEYTPEGQSCFTAGLSSANQSFYAFESNSSGGFVELEIEALDSVGNMEMLVFGPVELDSASYSGGVINDCVTGENPWPLFFNAGPNQTYILAIGSDLQGQIEVNALPSSIGLNGVLPVELTSYAISQRNGAVALDWSTADEINNEGFEIYRSQDGKSFENIGWVNAKEQVNNRYTYQDQTDMTGDVYYYIRQIDLNGQSKKYEILRTRIATTTTITLYPNPTHGDLYISNHGELPTTDISAKIYDTMGTLRFSQTIRSGQKIDLSKLSDGVYFIETVSGNERQVHRQVLRRS